VTAVVNDFADPDPTAMIDVEIRKAFEDWFGGGEGSDDAIGNL
jgi:hypothetical protein